MSEKYRNACGSCKHFEEGVWNNKLWKTCPSFYIQGTHAGEHRICYASMNKCRDYVRKESKPMFDTIKKRLEAAECFLKEDERVINLQFHVDRYSLYENLMIQTFEDGFPYARISINIKHLPLTMFAVDTNNFPEAEELLKSNGVAHNTGISLHSGFCEYPIYELEKWVYEE